MFQAQRDKYVIADANQPGCTMCVYTHIYNVFIIAQCVYTHTYVYIHTYITITLNSMDIYDYSVSTDIKLKNHVSF